MKEKNLLSVTKNRPGTFPYMDGVLWFASNTERSRAVSGYYSGSRAGFLLSVFFSGIPALYRHGSVFSIVFPYICSAHFAVLHITGSVDLIGILPGFLGSGFAACQHIHDAFRNTRFRKYLEHL